MNISIMEAVMLDMSVQDQLRDERGRFVPGRSGNPAGKVPGTRNRATDLRELLRDGEAVAAVRLAIDKALAGDAVTLRFLVGRLISPPRGRPIELELPEGARAHDIVAAFDATVRAMASGEITPDEAVQVTSVLNGRRKAIEAARREDKRNDRRAAVKPSLSGRGLGEGPHRAFASAGTASSKHPLPAPPERLSKGSDGEGTRLGERVRSSGSARAAGGERASFAANLLHSTCISRFPPPSWLAAASLARGYRSGLRRV